MSARNTGRKPRRRAARAVKPVLGNDPFERGAAPRPAAKPEVASVRTESAAPPPAAEAPVVEVPRITAPEEVPAAAAEAAEAAAATQAPTPTPAPGAEEREARQDAIHRLEERLAQLGAASERRLGEIGARLRETAARPQARIRDDLGILASRVVPAVREKLAKLAQLREVVEGRGQVDEWGLDHDLVRAATPALDFLVDTWWRVDARGIERVPADPVILVANHGGAAHWDAVVLAHLFRRAGRELRPLLDASALAGSLGRTAVRLGAVAASADAAEQLLANRRSIAVFPQGSRAGEQPWQDRYRIHQFGRGGFARIALLTGAPIVPCAVVGSEEASPPLARAGWLADALSMPLLASAPGFPLGPLAAVPLPSRWSVRFGAPVVTAGRAADAESAVAVNALAAEVRTTLQRMLDEDVAARRSVYL